MKRLEYDHHLLLLLQIKKQGTRPTRTDEKENENEKEKFKLKLKKKKKKKNFPKKA